MFNDGIWIKICYAVDCFLILTAGLVLIIDKFFISKFSMISLSEIIFHLKVPMAGTSKNMIEEFLSYAFVPLLLIIVFIIILAVILIRKKAIRKLKIVFWGMQVLTVLCVATAIFIFCMDFSVNDYLTSQMSTSTFIEDNYVEPSAELLTFPEKKRNLIYIFMESMESTFLSKDEGGAMDISLAPELAELAGKYVNFSEDDLVGGGFVAPETDWTMAGMIAQTAGLPLKIPIDHSSYGEYLEIVPGAVSLGELLEQEGYNQEIMVGSDITFGGRGVYFATHGNYKIWDYYTAVESGKIPEDYYVWWGYEDAKLYEYAKEELLNLASENTPFNFTMLTVDTHHIGGYVCDLCDDKFDVQYENVISCASRQVYSFISWVQQQDFYDNTTIIISGDHCSMDEEFIADYYDGSKPRRVYNCIINAPIASEHTKNRYFTTMDMFPTTLAAMGVKIKGERLGLGTNLFSDEMTLLEKYDYGELAELYKRSIFYDQKILYGR